MKKRKKVIPQILDIVPLKKGKIDEEKIRKIKPVLDLRYSLFEKKPESKEKSLPFEFFLKEKTYSKKKFKFSFEFLKKLTYPLFFTLFFTSFLFGLLLLKEKLNFLPQSLFSLSSSFQANLKLKEELILNQLKNLEIEKAKASLKETSKIFETSLSLLDDLSSFQIFSSDLKKFFFLKEKINQTFSLTLEAFDLVQASQKNLFSSLKGDPYSSKKLFASLDSLKQNLNLLSQNLNSFLSISDDFNFSEFKKDYLSFQLKIEEAKDLISFLEKFLGKEESKTYVLLFQNNAELRASGGFLGSFLVFSLNRARLTDFKVYDIYDPDGQIKEKYIPPKPLWLTTPVWKTRDANWFFDFSTSAKKIIYFLEKSGYFKKIDGVIAINTFPVKDFLEIIGPIELEEYQKTITPSNFFEVLEYEVEYGKDKRKGEPKRILKVLLPKIYEKLFELDQEKTKKLIKIFKENLEKKEIQLFFKDPFSQKIVQKYQFGGKVIEEPPFSDYLAIVFSNIAGGKTDLLIKRKAKLLSKIKKDGTLENTLIITQNYLKPSKNYPFYRTINKSYLRVYLPKEASLEEISGYKIRKTYPLVDYSLPQYLVDPDLEKIEMSSQVLPFEGVDLFFENGKKVIGFWVFTKKGKSSKVTLKYKVFKKINSPKNWQLVYQKQSGVKMPIEIILEDEKGEIKRFLKEDPKRIEIFSLKSFPHQ